MTFYNSKSTSIYMISFNSQSNPIKCSLQFLIKGNRGMKSSWSLNELISGKAESISS